MGQGFSFLYLKCGNVKYDNANQCMLYGKIFEPIYNGLFSFLSSQYNGYYDPFVLFDAIQFDKLNKRPYAVLFRFLSTYVKSKLMRFWGFYGPIYVLNILKSVWIDLLKLFEFIIRVWFQNQISFLYTYQYTFEHDESNYSNKNVSRFSLAALLRTSA